MVLSANDTEREHLSTRWSVHSVKIEVMTDGPDRDRLLEELDAIECCLGEMWLEQRADRVPYGRNFRKNTGH